MLRVITQEHAIIEVDRPGGRLVGESKGDGPAVVLLHAGIADRRMWNEIMSGLAEAYRVVRFDFRGFGESPPSTEPYRSVDDVGAVLDALDIERAHLVGASMGGGVAMEFALAQPDRVRTLSLLASNLPGFAFSPQIHGYWEAEEAALTRGDIETTVDLNLDTWIRGYDREWSDRSLAVADTLRDALRVIAANQSRDESLELGADRPVIERLSELAVPALVMIAESDLPDLVTIGEVLAARLAGADLVRMPDTAHLPALERPAETLTALCRFLAAHR